MSSSRKKVLIFAYYLSKYNKIALQNLKYKTYKEAYNDASIKLGINPNTIKNRRDDFDSIHDNGRSGWYQKELPKSSLEIVAALKNVSEDALTEIVKDILYKNSNLVTELIETEIKDSQSQNNRGKTGKRAEELFIQYHKEGYFNNYSGDLVDTRDEGSGYDFIIDGPSRSVFEVKGLSTENGGISFTDKEWDTAKSLRNKYNLVIFSNVFENPRIKVINNPYLKLNPKQHIYRTIAVSWSIQSKDL